MNDLGKQWRVFIITTVVALCSIAGAQAAPRVQWKSRHAQRIAAQQPDTLAIDTTIDVSSYRFPSYFFIPAIYDHYILLDSLRPLAIPTRQFDMSGTGRDSKNPNSQTDTSAVDTALMGKAAPIKPSPLKWVDDELRLARQMWEMKQNYMIANPQLVKYNEQWLPEPPKQYRAVIDPSKAIIVIEEVPVDKNQLVDEVPQADVIHRNWLHNFNGSAQFSQAYISPNWYQGGNNNLNMIANLVYNVKLNQAFHPNLLFENTVQYKLGLNSAPDDSIRSYSISEDLLQINSKFGVKAARRWFYSITLMFKTQLFNGYKSNTNDLKAAFLSPGELNLGLGMTYNYVTPDKRLTFDASIAPLSYNLKTCINSRMDETAYGIRQRHSTVSQYGSNAEAKLLWKLTRNITYSSRLFVFTDYSYIQGDWENTFDFSVNRYISTQIYIHARYDSSSARQADCSWHKWQLKEILSFGFSYKFSTI